MKSMIGVNLTPFFLEAVLVDAKQAVKQKYRVDFQEAIFTPASFPGWETLKKELAKMPLEMRLVEQLSIALPSSLFYSKFLVLKEAKQAKIKEYLDANADELFPFSTEEIYYDWKVIRHLDSESEIAVVATPKELIDKIVSVFEASQLKPLVFIPASIALLNLYRYLQEHKQVVLPAGKEKVARQREGDKKGNMAKPQQTARKGLILFEKGIKELIFTTVVDHTPIFGSSLRWQGEVQKSRDKLNSTLEKLLAFCDRKYKERFRFNHLLTFDKSLVNYLDVDLKQKLTLEMIEPAKVVNNIEPGKERLFVAFGAALHQSFLPQEPETINLLPLALQDYYLTEERYKKETGYLKGSLFALLILLFIILTAGGIVFWQKNVVKRQYAEFKKSYKIDGAFVELEKKANRLNNNVAKINHLSEIDVFSLTSLEQIEESSQGISGITISEFKYNRETERFYLAGITERREDLLQFKKNLEAVSGFTDIVIPLSSLEQETNFAFSLSFKLQ